MKTTALRATAHALRPIVRLLLMSGVMYQQAASLLKELFVDIATNEYGVRGRPTNVSRVALMTGLDRKEVRRLRGCERDSAASRAQPDRLSRVLAAWHQNEEFRDQHGKPLHLDRVGTHPSFESLVGRFGGDIPPTTMLKEFQRVGAVAADSDGRLWPRTRYYLLHEFDDASVSRAGGVLEDLGNTVFHNLSRDTDTSSLFEGRASNHFVDQKAVEAFHAFVELEAQIFLEKVDQWLTDHESSKGKQVVRLGMGVYAIQGPSELVTNGDEAT